MGSQVRTPHGIAKVSFVVVNWNGKDYLAKCLDSIFKTDYPLRRVIVSDNGSTDGSAEMIRAVFGDKVTVIENGKNYGAPIARNVGMRRALEDDVDFLFCLDNDLVIAPEAIGILVEILRANPSIAMVGALILDMDRPDVILTAGGLINWTQNMVKTLGANQKDVGQFKGIWDVDYAGSGALMVRTEFVKKHGMFDESFIGYGYEDTDYGMRAKRLGYRVVCSADARVWHRLHSGIGRYSFKKKYLETYNSIRFIRRYGNAWSWIKYLFFVIAGFVYAFFREGLRGNMPGVIGKIRGFIDGLRNREDLALKLLDDRTKR